MYILVPLNKLRSVVPNNPKVNTVLSELNRVLNNPNITYMGEEELIAFNHTAALERFLQTKSVKFLKIIPNNLYLK